MASIVLVRDYYYDSIQILTTKSNGVRLPVTIQTSLLPVRFDPLPSIVTA